MTHLEGIFPVNNHTSLFYQAWLPESKPKAAIVLVHGLADHSGRYGNVVNCLLARGYAIWSYDQRGHGKSPGTRCYVNRFSDLINDLKMFVAVVAERNPEYPIFLVGHSMGDLESAAFVADHPQHVSGVVLSGLLLKPGQSVPAFIQSLVKVLSFLAPRLGVQQLECAAISRDQSVVNAYLDDPLVYNGKISARMGAELITAMTTVESRIKGVTMPILLLHGGSDRLADPSSSQFAFDNVSSTDKELRFFPGCYHEIFNEPCRDFVLGTLSKWLDSHVPA